ncbi:MAG: hypothetical protein CSA62_12810 [Planctomycetota bacterium]|nr:MAG: hypothetical protein CSA62_12810 [Planctomycetota bacterium]
MDERSREKLQEPKSSLDDGLDASEGSGGGAGGDGGSARERDQERSEFLIPEVEESRDRDFVTVPAGSYVCRIEDARTRYTRAGDRLWALKWVVDEGPQCGRLAAWDNVVFSLRAAARARRVLEALGLPSRGKVRLGAQDFIGRRAVLEIQVGGFEHPASGVFVRRNEVTYDGVRPLETSSGRENAGEDAASEDGSDIPF